MGKITQLSLDEDTTQSAEEYLAALGLKDIFEDDDDSEWDDIEDCYHDAECVGSKHSSRCNTKFWEVNATGSVGTALPTSSFGSFGSWSKHEHKQEAYTLSDGTVIHCSSHHYRPLSEEPDLACYLDGCWKPATVAFHLGWQDYGLPYVSMEKVRIIADELLAAARNGRKVEIGCIGGHGRTGSFLAILDILTQPEGEADAAATMKRIWDTYCDRAIESKEQEWYIACWAADRNGEEFPAKPVKPAPKPAEKKASKPAAKVTTKVTSKQKKTTVKRKASNRPAGSQRFGK